MNIVKIMSGIVLRKAPSATKITVPKAIADLMELDHKDKLDLTLTETGQLIIEKAK